MVGVVDKDIDDMLFAELNRSRLCMRCWLFGCDVSGILRTKKIKNYGYWEGKKNAKKE